MSVYIPNSEWNDFLHWIDEVNNELRYNLGARRRVIPTQDSVRQAFMDGVDSIEFATEIFDNGWNE